MATLAPVLRQGRSDINAAWPARLTQKRGYDSDGWLGDASHKAKKSDHNPDGNGIVHAIDIDVDMLDPARLMAALIRHPSTRYVIYKDRIYHRSNGFKAARYTGVYHHHMHWSIEHTNAARNSGSRLALGGGGPIVGGGESTKAGGGMSRFPTLRRSNTVSAAVKTFQRASRPLGSGLTVDGKFGPASAGWTSAYQRDHGLKVDGVVGPATWCAVAQGLLNARGANLRVDGKWGPATYAATVAFQRARGLAADGVFGPKTMAAASA